MRLTLNLEVGGEGLKIDEGLRGWCLKPYVGRDGVKVKPSELASPCPVRRDVWLVRHGLRLKGDSVSRGRFYHEEISTILREAVWGGWDGVRRAVNRVETHAGAWALSIAYAWLLNGSIPPMIVEPRLPPVLGFTSSSPDLVIGSSPAEIAYSPSGLNGGYASRKRVELAAYSLIIEALTGMPVNHAWLIVVTDSRVLTEAVMVCNSLREKALRAREEVASVLSGGEPPQPPGNCPPSCPFIRECLGGGNG